MNHVLVTGGAGYIGSIFCSIGQSQLEKVVVLDDLSKGQESNVPNNCYLVRGNIGDCFLVERLLKEFRIDTVVHFAASVDVEESIKNPALYFENNLANSVKLLSSALKFPVKNFIFSSTAAVYGNTNASEVCEEDLPQPLSPYGESKLIFENILKKCWLNSRKFAILRYFNVAGAKADLTMGPNKANSTHLIQVAAEAALGQRSHVSIFGNDYNTRDGTGIRDYIHVEDLAEAHLKVLSYLNSGGESEVFNLGYGLGYTVMEVLQAMQNIAHFPVQIVGRREGDIEGIVANNSKVIKKLNWKPKFNDINFICRSAYEWQSAKLERVSRVET